MSKLTKKQTYGIFIAKFVFSLLMIAWTIMWTMKANIIDDEEDLFFETYHDTDFDYDKIVKSNEDFNKKYNLTFIVNEYKLDSFDTKDIFVPKRVLEKRKDRKNILKVGDNIIKIYIKNKKTNKPISFNAKVKISMPFTNKGLAFDINSSNNVKKINIDKKAYFDIMSKITIDKSSGYILIKTNSK